MLALLVLSLCGFPTEPEQRSARPSVAPEARQVIAPIPGPFRAPPASAVVEPKRRDDPSTLNPKPANVPKLKTDLPPVPPVLSPVEMRVPDRPVLVDLTAMAEKPPDRALMAAKMPRPTSCACEPGECQCCTACSCGGKAETATPVSNPLSPVAIPASPVSTPVDSLTLYQLTDRFGQLWTSPDKANLEAWVASRNALQPAVWQPATMPVQPPYFYRTTRPGMFRTFGSTCVGGVCW